MPVISTDADLVCMAVLAHEEKRAAANLYQVFANLSQGFVDAHLHLMMGAQTLESLDLNSVRSREELARALAAAAGVLWPTSS